MAAAPLTPPEAGSIDPADLVLRAVADNLAAVIEAEIRQFQMAVWWAEIQPGDAVDLSVPWADRELQVAGDGAPTVAEFAVADFALTAGMSTDAGRHYLGDAVETCHRLPRLWARVIAGEVRVWKARQVARSTHSLSPEGAAYVDHVLAHVAHKCSYAEIERQVTKARAAYDPDQVEADRLSASDGRYFRIRSKEVTTNGLVHVDGLVDLPAALALESAVTDRAHALLDSDPTLPLDTRRAMAVGLLGAAESPPEIVLYAHSRPGTNGMVEVANTRSLVTIDELIEWCSLAGARVTLKPVLDLSAELCRDGYEPTPAQHEQAILINRPASSQAARDHPEAATSTTSSRGPWARRPPPTSPRSAAATTV
jgi:hypothetical protein